MEVQRIGEGSPPEVQWTTAQQVQRLAEENAAAQLKSSAVPVAPSPIHTADKTYSPAIYAQAAQFQLYTQSGTLAAMLAAHGAANSIPPPTTNDGDAIKAVEGAESSGKLDTRA